MHLPADVMKLELKLTTEIVISTGIVPGNFS